MDMERLELEAAVLTRSEPETAFLLKRLKRHHYPTYRQSLLTAHYARRLAEALSYSSEARQTLYRTALLHDIGKLHIDKETLDGRNRLVEGGLWRLQEHPKLGAAILERMIGSGAVDGDAVLHHHENLDGTGFPFGLTYASISTNARILRIAGNFTTMTDAYSSIGLSREEALEELYRWSDVLFDGELVELMNRLHRERRLGESEKEDAGYDGIKRNRNS
ncbi:HD-GYP domain-containing protein [Paenibacillus sp. GYB003]|uniref:HD-GYP domain-containing protein n=1 Tax=Paenibacillus sp. GYB003 TaxID=2994392 RepID=UPI002F967F74